MNTHSFITVLDHIAGNGHMYQIGSHPIYRLRSVGPALHPDLLPVIKTIMVRAGWGEGACAFICFGGRLAGVSLGVEKTARSWTV